MSELWKVTYEMFYNLPTADSPDISKVPKLKTLASKVMRRPGRYKVIRLDTKYGEPYWSTFPAALLYSLSPTIKGKIHYNLRHTYRKGRLCIHVMVPTNCFNLVSTVHLMLLNGSVDLFCWAPIGQNPDLGDKNPEPLLRFLGITRGMWRKYYCKVRKAEENASLYSKGVWVKNV